MSPGWRRRFPQSRVARACCEALESRCLLNAGDLDSAFGLGGKSQIRLDNNYFDVVDVAFQSDGKVLLAGQRVVGPTIFEGTDGVVRLNVDGSLDTTFGGGDGFADFGVFNINGIAVEEGYGILLAGTVYNSGRDADDFAVARLQFSGSPDPGFGGGDAIFQTTFAGTFDFEGIDEARAVVVQQDGQILAAGAAHLGTFIFDDDFAVVRLNPNGTLDDSFSGDGKFVRDIGWDDTANAIAIDYNGDAISNPRYGQIVVAGEELDRHDPINTSDDESKYAVVRLNPNGSYDVTLDGDGVLSTSFAPGADSRGSGVVIQADSRIVVSGNHRYGFGSAGTNFLTARYTLSGSLDTTFGGSGTGYFETDFGGTESRPDLAINYAGGLIVGGYSTISGSGANLVLAAYTGDGVIDTRFSGDGLLALPIASGGFVNGSIALSSTSVLPTRRIVIAGGTSSVARVVDVGSLISIGTFNPQMYEQGAAATSFLVTRTRVLNTDETIFLGVTGSMTRTGVNRDFNSTGITWGSDILGTPTKVIIPAGQTFANVVLTPIDDALVEGDELLTLTIGTTASYDASFDKSITLVLRDNEASGPPIVNFAGFNYETAPQSVSIRFNQSVQSSIADNDFQLTGPAGLPGHTFAYDTITNTVTLSFNTPLPDGNYIARAIASGIHNGANQNMASDYVLAFFQLAGDANRDRQVNLYDLVILATNWQGTGETIGQGDFNYDGIVDSADLGILATRWQQSLAAPALPVPGQPSPTGPSRSPARTPTRVIDLVR